MNITSGNSYFGNIYAAGFFSNSCPTGNITLPPQLEKDTVSFSDYRPSVFDRNEGFACSYFDYEKKNDILNNVPTFKNNKTFGLKEYKNLTPEEKMYLDSLLEESYFKGKPYVFAKSDKSMTISDDAEFLIKIADEAKKSLEERYPNGCKITALGGSTAIFSKIYEYEGKEAKIIPYSCDVIIPDFDYKKYFSQMGVNSTDNSKHKIVFLDFVKTGNTFNNLKQTLKSANIPGLNNADCVSFMELLNRKIPFSEYSTLADYYFENEAIKSFCPCPKMSSKACWQNADKIEKDFNWSNSTKLINYAIIKKLDEAGRLKEKI